MTDWLEIVIARGLSAFPVKAELRHNSATHAHSVVFRKGQLLKEVSLKPETVDDLKNLAFEHDRFFEATYRMQFHENTTLEENK